MDIAWINIGLAFIEGFALIVSPCILPILPIVLSGSLTGSKSRPFGIIIGFVITFTIVTLFSKVIIDLAHINPDTIRYVSFIILILLGVMMMSSYLTEKFLFLTQGLMRVGDSIQSANQTQGGLLSGILFGALIGIIWTPCAGPILAAVIVQVIIQQTTLSSILTVIAFAIGAGVPMLLIAILGREIMEKFSFFRLHTVFIRRVLGIIIIASALLLMFVPNIAVPTSIKMPTLSTSNRNNSPQDLSLMNGLVVPYKAPEIVGIDAWINSPPLTISALKGKVILIDFWTYSCINCIRTLPYLINWYAKYHDNGFLIIGVHSPEFEFEHQLQNVQNAVKTYGILYPVALDNQFKTWQNYHNQYWPAHYLIDKEGNVVYVHFGEGEYDVTENNIRYLLGINKPILAAEQAEHYSMHLTPETYFGYNRAENFSSLEKAVYNTETTYHYPDKLSENEWALRGKWIIYGDKIVAKEPGASIKLQFNAKNVYAVMGAQGKTINVMLRLNNEPITHGKGSDVSNSQVDVSLNRLYSLISFQQAQEATLEMIVTSPGLEMYTFTFGG